MALSTTATPSSGEQTSTQTPQSAGQPGNSGAVSSSVQPGTATALLNSAASNGVPLHGTPLSTVSFGTNTSTQTTVLSPPVAHRHINAGLLGISIVLCLIGIGMFWATSRSAKTTTV